MSISATAETRFPVDVPYKETQCTLANVIAWVETRNVVSDVRYEPDWKPDIQVARKIARYNRCTIPTAFIIAKTSYGLYQIMGSNVYDLGFTGAILDFWRDARQQLTVLGWFCNRHDIAYTLQDIVTDPDKLRLFSLHYNGNPLLYSQAIREAFFHLTGQAF